MRFRKTTAKNVSKDLRALASYLDGEGASDVERRDVATWLNSRLDEMLSQDAFGTEGQCDPRGDHRS